MPRRALILTLSLFAVLSARAAEPPLKSGIDPANFDTAVQPGQDFFQYVNGNWIKRNPIPAEYSRWGAFPQLRDNNLVALHRILGGLVEQSAPLEGNPKKLSAFYITAMDEARLEQQGAAPLAAELEQIAAIKTPQEMTALLAHFHAAGLPALFALSVAPDEKKSDRYAVHLRQGGLGLPERNYYFDDTDDAKRIRAQYHDHVAKMLALLSDTPHADTPDAAATAAADAVLRIETRLAEASRTPTQLRDREAQYNKHTLRQLKSLAPDIDWPAYLQATGLPAAEPVDSVIVGQPEFLARVNELLPSVPIADWRTYLRWHLVHHTAPYLSDAFERENFRFYNQTLRGIKEMQPRWKRAITSIDRLMGEALGKLYVEKYFTADAKRRMDQLVQNILAVYAQRIQSRDWMSQATKSQALAKLALFTPKIGYPDRWRDYSALEIKSDSYVQNVLRAQAFETRYRLARLRQPVDRAEWHMTPPTVNAYYNSTMNEIVFPAGILQPPFFDPAADDAVNYGGIGAVIGHEITHGFDDQGSRSDGQGNLKNWWTPEDRAKFNAKTDKLAAQYYACTLQGTLHVNGRLTLGENIADLGGVAIAYAAYQKSLNGQPAPTIDGLTGQQRFFIGYAQIWRGAIRDADQRLLLRTDPHSPSQFRTNIPLSNFQPFYETFDLKSTDALYRPPEDRVEVW